MKAILFALLLAFHSYAGEIQVFFSPDGGCTDAVVSELASTREARGELPVQGQECANALKMPRQANQKTHRGLPNPTHDS